jgi:hypothetical protein
MTLKIRVFDSILQKSRGNSAGRNASDFWRPFCDASGWKFNYERVHSLQDVEFFFSKKIKEEIIIFSGHGCDQDGFLLSNGDKIDGTQNFTKVAGNSGKIVIFSSCLIGGNKRLATSIKSSFAANTLFAYRHVIEDRFCFLNESILLTMLGHNLETERKKSFTRNDFDDFSKKTNFMKNINQKSVRTHPLVMF